MEDDPKGNPVARLFETDDPALRDTCLAEALDLVCNGDVADRSMAVAHEWRDQALAAIADLPRNAHREALEGIADFVTQRDF